jgi:mono/diheme cytochrome c family protein
MKMLAVCMFVAAGMAQAASLVQDAPPDAAMRNPFDGSERAQRAGAKLFARECASCHGENGLGGLGKAPPLRQKEVYEAPPGALFWILRNGSLNRGMPSFAHLPEAQRWQIIAWLKARR